VILFFMQGFNTERSRCLFQTKKKRNKKKKITEEVKSSAFKVLARPKSPAIEMEILKLEELELCNVA
jgi:hypothetical protein